MAKKRRPLPLTSCSSRGSMTFPCLLGIASGASLSPLLSGSFHYIGNQRFCVLVKVVLASYLCVATNAARSLLRSTVEEAAAAANAEQRLASGGLPGHYFGAATDAAQPLLRSTADDLTTTVSGKGRRFFAIVGRGGCGNGRRRIAKRIVHFSRARYLSILMSSRR